MTCPGSLDGSHEAVMHRLIHLTIRWIAGMVGWLVGWLVGVTGNLVQAVTNMTSFIFCSGFAE